MLANVHREVGRVGTGPDVLWRVQHATTARRRATFTLRGPDLALDIVLRVAGLHNVANAAVVAALALSVDVEPDAVRRGLIAFEGAPRRFEFLGTWGEADVYEDYAHLPGEIAATLAAARAAGYQRITAVFQPHRVTRTVALASDFAPAFDAADHVVVTDIYPAGEPNPTGVTGELIADELVRRGLAATQYCHSLDDVPDALEGLRDDSDVIVLLGAGDVASVASALSGGLRR